MKDWFAKIERKALGFGLGLFVLAFLLRLIGIGWGLPTPQRLYSLHPDETVIWTYSQQVNPAKFQFTPGFYNYGTFYLTLLHVATDITSAYGGPIGETEAEQRVAVGRFHMAGRMISALAGAGLVWVVFLMLYRRTHILGACLGAAAVGVAPGLVMHSRFQTVDVVATFLLSLSLLYATKLLPPDAEEPLPDKVALKLTIWSGVFAGLSAGTKYTGILALIALFICCWPYAKKWMMMAVGAATGCLVFLLTTPGMILDSAKFWTDFKYEMTHTATGHGLVFAATTNGFVYHITNIFVALGLGVLVLGVGGLGRALFRRHLWALALTVFALAYFILIGRAEVKFVRYVFPLLPVLAVGFGWIIGQAHTHPRRSMKAVVVFGILALGGFPTGGAAGAQKVSYWMATTDPRDDASAWLRKNVEPGETVGLASDPWFYSPSLYPEVAAPRWVPFEQRLSWMQAASDPTVVAYVEPGAEGIKQFDVRLLTEVKPTYLVASSFEIDDFARIDSSPSAQKEFAKEYAAYKEFEAEMMKSYEPAGLLETNNQGVAFGTDGWAMHDLMYVRPKIWIWKRKASP